MRVGGARYCVVKLCAVGLCGSRLRYNIYSLAPDNILLRQTMRSEGNEC